ncbi:MAG TPA: PilZ domain-containing protein [Terriglobia bacterium]|nr:PilZ domain-containing protein [Terriglobia bacterium]
MGDISRALEVCYARDFDGALRGPPVGLKYLFFCDTLLNVAKTSYTVRRRSERRPIRLALVLLMDSDEGEIRNEAFMLDMSQHGCRVEGVESIREGQLVRLLPLQSPQGAMAGRVVWVGEPASELAGEAGIEFLQPLPSMV